MKNMFGIYSLPLTEEERTLITPRVVKHVTDGLSAAIAAKIISQLVGGLVNSKSNFKRCDLEGVKKDIELRMSHYIGLLKCNHPGIAELNNDLDFFYTVEANDDGIPMLVSSQWLKDLHVGKVKLTIDSGIVFQDDLLVSKYNDMIGDNSDLREQTELGELVASYNSELSGITYDDDYDFTEVIMKMLSDEKLRELVITHNQNKEGNV